MQKLAVVSDIHGNIAALEKVVEDINLRNVDAIFNLGDHISGPLWPRETIQFLMSQDWVQISGNHERQLISQAPQNQGPSDQYAFQFLGTSELDWLKALPASQTVEDQFLLVHGTPDSDKSYLLETVFQGSISLATPPEITHRIGTIKSPVVFCGHSHLPRVVEINDETLIVNPGSVGLPAYTDTYPEAHVVETGSPHARYAILEFKHGNWIPELIAVPYDYPLAAKQARKNNRPDWEVALQTGFMNP